MFEDIRDLTVGLVISGLLFHIVIYLIVKVVIFIARLVWKLELREHFWKIYFTVLGLWLISWWLKSHNLDKIQGWEDGNNS